MPVIMLCDVQVITGVSVYSVYNLKSALFIIVRHILLHEFLIKKWPSENVYQV